MSKAAEEEHAYYHVLRVVIVAFLKGISPILAVESGRRAIPGHVRPSFQELESDVGTFFNSGSSEPSPSGKEMLVMLAQELAKLPNRVSIEGHTDSKLSAGKGDYGNWELSADRANAARRLMHDSGLRGDQVTQVRGFADQRLRKPGAPEDSSNRRISLIVQYVSRPSPRNRPRPSNPAPARPRRAKPAITEEPGSKHPRPCPASLRRPAPELMLNCMADFEKLGAFCLGRPYDRQTGVATSATCCSLSPSLGPRTSPRGFAKRRPRFRRPCNHYLRRGRFQPSALSGQPPSLGGARRKKRRSLPARIMVRGRNRSGPRRVLPAGRQELSAESSPPQDFKYPC
jgi:hypothetical protein